MKAEEVLSDIMSKMLEQDLVISSCGLISKYLFTKHHRPQNFYNVGAMGTTLPFAIGVALNTTKQVHAIIGDGELLSNLGSLVQMEHLSLENLHLYIINNNVYDTTGGQPTIIQNVILTNIKNMKEYNVAPFEERPNNVTYQYQKIKEDFQREVRRV